MLQIERDASHWAIPLNIQPPPPWTSFSEGSPSFDVVSEGYFLYERFSEGLVIFRFSEGCLINTNRPFE